MVYPDDAAPYVIAICYTGPLASGDARHDPAAALLAGISAQIWAQRHELRSGRVNT